MNEQYYKDIYNYLKYIRLPNTDNDKWKNNIRIQSNKYFIQHNQLFRR